MIEHFNFHESWVPIVKPAIESQDFLRVLKRIQSGKVTPHPTQMFRAFEMPLSEVRLVFLGQDPYPQPGVATGLAFASKEMTPFLQIMLEELEKTPDFNEFLFFQNTELLHWERQGILLLNSALTTYEGRSGTNSEWHPVMQSILDNMPPKIFVKFGKKAQLFRTKGISLQFAHPAADTYGDKKLFRGSNCFNLINKHLSKKIKWDA